VTRGRPQVAVRLDLEEIEELEDAAQDLGLTKRDGTGDKSALIRIRNKFARDNMPKDYK
jgi:hypothetical protein